MIRRYPNGATRYDEVVTFREIGKRTRRTETSKYPEEEKTKVISRVEAIEMETAQTRVVKAILGL